MRERKERKEWDWVASDPIRRGERQGKDVQGERKRRMEGREKGKKGSGGGGRKES